MKAKGQCSVNKIGNAGIVRNQTKITVISSERHNMPHNLGQGRKMIKEVNRNGLK